jgi:hypothetical protein
LFCWGYIVSIIAALISIFVGENGIYLLDEYVILYYGTILREEHTLRMFENRVMRMFAPKKDEVTGGWRKLHNEELHNLYSLPSIIRMVKSRRMR